MFHHDPSASARRHYPFMLPGVLCASLVCAAGAAADDAAHEHPHQLEEIVVTADPLGAIESHLAAPVSVLDRDALARQSNRSIGETVGNVPGVNVSDFGASVGRPVIRGLGGARVRVLENGIGTMDVSTLSADHGVAIESVFAEQVEIFRGPATLLYGSGASGGLVNVVNRRIPRAVPETLGGELYSHYDTAADGWLGAFQGELPLGEHVALHVDGLRRDTGDIDIPGFAAVSPDTDERRGVLENSDAETDNYAVGLSYIGARGFVGFNVSHLANDYGVPGAHHHHEDEGHEDHEDHDDDEHAEDHEEEEGGTRIALQQTRYDVEAELAVGAFGVDRARTRWAYSDYTHDEIEGDGSVGTAFTNEEIEGRVELVHRPLGAFDGAIGMQYADRSFAAVGEEAFVPPAAQDSIAVFVFEKADFGRLHLDAGLRYEAQDARDRTRARTASHELLSLSGGLGYEFLPGWSAGLAVTRAERAPSIEELFAGGPHLATNTYEIGDPNLGEETSTNVDVSVRKRAGRYRLEATFFYNDIDDFVYLASNDRNGDGIADRVEADFAATGLVVDEDDALLLVDQRQRDARFWGFELAAATTVFDDGRGRLDLDAWSDYVDAELSGGARVPRMPPLRFGLGARWSRGPFALGCAVIRVTDVDSPAALETRTDGYTMINVDATWTRRAGDLGELELFARGTNLADQTARRHVSFVKDIAPLPGVGGVIGARLRF
ncbi:MAG: TonB-dependent receptor [Gammaproteobacteria bacterium]